MSIREEAPGQTQDTLKGLYLSTILGMPRDPPEELVKVAGGRTVWASLLRLLPPDPDSDKRLEDGRTPCQASYC
ncbi:hypothetical protein L3Q82_012924 [Scortum barcoo]|uniref:Uncharacterized protein n=1 Tax=Scortum barcoo TaxID=214431 RepID=A0ACB8W236_9TELE|nr:hypothetical protein L3Q82_012924 [Scortum barcoo]